MDPDVRAPAGKQPNAAYCQHLCATTASCHVFTYIKATSNCWLQGASLDTVSMTGAVSGPRTCAGTSPAATAAAAEAAALPTLGPPPTPAPAPAPSVAKVAPQDDSPSLKKS